MNKKTTIDSIAEDYADVIFEQFESVVMDFIERTAPGDVIDVVNKHIDCERYDTDAISKELLSIEVQDVLEVMKNDFDIKYLKKIKERVKEKMLDMTFIDYLLE